MGRPHSYGQSIQQDFGPPYIVKLSSLPITCNDAFIEDLFKSRYTPFVKFKIVIDPSSNVLETHIVKKIAFVELHSFQDFSKALKWQDLYYKAGRRVNVEPADFSDFQYCITFNKEHEKELEGIEDEFLSGKTPRHSQYKMSDTHKNINNIGAQKSDDLPPLKIQPSKPKFNPFGSAKPVDVLAKLHEIDKKLITVNHTTIKTIGSEEKDETSHPEKRKMTIKSPKKDAANVEKNGHVKHDSENKRQPMNILKRSTDKAQKMDVSEFKEHSKKEQHSDKIPKEIDGKSPEVPLEKSHVSGNSGKDLKEANETRETMKKFSPAPIPASNYSSRSNGLSLAQLLSSDQEGHVATSPGGRKTPIKSKSSAPKKSAAKPVILKKKVTVQPAVGDETADSKEEPKEGNEASKEEALVNENGATLEEKQNIAKSAPASSSNNDEKASSNPSNENRNVRRSSLHPTEERPDFRKHLNEIVKRSNAAKMKRNNSNNSSQASSRSDHLSNRRPQESERRNRGASRDMEFKKSSKLATSRIEKSNSSTDGAKETNQSRSSQLSDSSLSPESRSASLVNRTPIPKKYKLEGPIDQERKSQNHLSRNNRTDTKKRNGSHNELKSKKSEIARAQKVKHEQDKSTLKSASRESQVKNETKKSKGTAEVNNEDTPAERGSSKESKESADGFEKDTKLPYARIDRDISFSPTGTEHSNTSPSRGRGATRSRGSNKGPTRSSLRGSRGNYRGNGRRGSNFNLHYVRNKTDDGKIDLHRGEEKSNNGHNKRDSVEPVSKTT
ncbi:uncharacterized protein PRCAT00005418001 [Priceomyces carsonii]|uniref:uncharacterized protein n=1 Tax=Priceomyces carsonii TaxID=28549 RepID=UPI002ED873CB|nr:unnamed protein product [Priceomyces carsonii]